MPDPGKEMNQAPLPVTAWCAREAYPMITSGTHSREYVTIPTVVQKIGENIYGDKWLTDDEAKSFPLGCVSGRYFKLIRNPKYKGKSNKPPKRLYLDEFDPKILESAYAKFKEIREKIKEAIDEESFRIALSDSRSGIRSINDKYYLIRKINRLVATGRIRASGHDDGDPYEMVLINSADFYAWLSGPEVKERVISSARLDTILGRINNIAYDLEVKIIKDDLLDIFDDIRSNGFSISDNQINEKIWKNINPSLKSFGAPGKRAEQFSIGKAKVKDIVEFVLGLKVDDATTLDQSQAPHNAAQEPQEDIDRTRRG
ncbi:MAG: hypothetical protein IKD58_17415 [Loktanella sp.]|nr:hypothetical protein [Loktanella sp.]